jgi:colicin import membrane protein
MLEKTELHPYRKPFLLALALHVVLLICLLSNFNLFSKQPAAAKNPANNAIKAVAVNPNELQKKVDALKAAEQKKLNTEKQQQEEELKQQEEKKAAAAAAESQKKIEVQKKIEENKLAETAKLEAQQKATKEKAQKEKEEKEQKAQKEKLEKTIQKQMEQKKKKLADKKTKQEKEKTLQEQLDAEAATAETPTEESAETVAETSAAAAAQAGEIDKYKGLIIDAIGQQWIVPDNANKELSAILLIRLAPGGMVLDVKLVKSSGDPALDRSAIAAVYKASPLPVPTEPELFDKMREISLTVQPEGK